jgi:hypothetical protein
MIFKRSVVCRAFCFLRFVAVREEKVQGKETAGCVPLASRNLRLRFETREALILLASANGAKLTVFATASPERGAARRARSQAASVRPTAEGSAILLRRSCWQGIFSVRMASRRAVRVIPSPTLDQGRYAFTEKKLNLSGCDAFGVLDVEAVPTSLVE